MPLVTSSGISGRFQPLSRGIGQITHVLLTRSPLKEDCSSFRSTCMSHPRRQRSVWTKIKFSVQKKFISVRTFKKITFVRTSSLFRIVFQPYLLLAHTLLALSNRQLSSLLKNFQKTSLAALYQLLFASVSCLFSPERCNQFTYLSYFLQQPNVRLWKNRSEPFIGKSVATIFQWMRKTFSSFLTSKKSSMLVT